MSKSDRVVLVTGAAGCIGSRVVERLRFDSDVTVRALVHSSGPKLARLARHPVDVTIGDVRDTDLVAELVADCDEVVHCAVGDKSTTVEGTRTVLSAAGSKVDRFVHLSTYVVHGWNPGIGTLSEDTPLNPSEEQYAQTKASAERAVWKAVEYDAVPAVVLRPGIVYGPYSVWSYRPFREIKSGAVLPDDGQGLANLVYVEDVVDAILAALETKEAVGEALLLADDTPITWGDYYERYRSLLTEPPEIRYLPAERTTAERYKQLMVNSLVPPLQVAVLAAREMAGGALGSERLRSRAVNEFRHVPWIRYVYVNSPEPIRSRLRDIVFNFTDGESDVDKNDGNGQYTPRYSVPEPHTVSLQTSQTRISNEKAKSLLGWEPSFGFDDGFALTAKWAKYEGLL